MLVNLTMLQGFVGVKDINGVAWTLQIELVFYALCLGLFLAGRLDSARTQLGCVVFFLLCALGLGALRFALERKLPVALPLALGTGAACGVLNGVLIGYLRLPAILATLGTMQAVGGLGIVVTGGPAVTGLPDWYAATVNAAPGGIPVPLIVFAVVLVALGLLLRFSSTGVEARSGAWTGPSAVTVRRAPSTTTATGSPPRSIVTVVPSRVVSTRSSRPRQVTWQAVRDSEEGSSGASSGRSARLLRPSRSRNTGVVAYSPPPLSGSLPTSDTSPRPISVRMTPSTPTPRIAATRARVTGCR